MNNNAYFYKEVFTENGNSAFIDPVDNEVFVIKLKVFFIGYILNNPSPSVPLQITFSVP